MHADGTVLASDRASMLDEHLAAWRNKRPRMFWVGLAAAFLVHALFIVGIGSARQRTLGTPDGASDAIAVEIVDGATLKDSMELPTPSTPPPGAQQQTAALPAEQPAPPPPEPQAEPQPQPPAETAQPPPETKALPQETPNETAEALPAFEEAPEGETTPPKAAPETAQPKAEAKKPAKKPTEKQQAKQPPKKRTQTSALDLSVPYEGSSSAEDGGSSAVQRPPGITRSGENDAFALDVIRALKRSMPRENAQGRVTVKIVLNENGSRADVKLMQSGGNPDLDFNVMFAARQTAYPFPPKNSTLVDRTFTVTYIYR